MARVMEGVITIVQESRFQLVDDGGIAHLFTLAPNAAAETDQLPPLERAGTRVRVKYSESGNITGNVATRIATIG